METRHRTGKKEDEYTSQPDAAGQPASAGPGTTEGGQPEVTRPQPNPKPQMPRPPGPTGPGRPRPKWEHAR